MKDFKKLKLSAELVGKEDTKTILSRRDFFIKSLSLAGVAGVIVSAEACACLSLAPPPCDDPESVRLDLKAKWIWRESKFMVEVSIERMMFDRTVQLENGTLRSQPSLMGNRYYFNIIPDTNEDNLTVGVGISCSSIGGWDKIFSFTFDTTAPEKDKLLLLIDQRINPA